MQEDAPSLSNVDSLEAEQPLNEISQDSHGQSLSPASIETKTPDGQLKRDFRLGGRPSTISSRLISFVVDLSLDLIDWHSILPWSLTFPSPTPWPKRIYLQYCFCFIVWCCYSLRFLRSLRVWYANSTCFSGRVGKRYALLHHDPRLGSYRLRVDSDASSATDFASVSVRDNGGTSL